MTLNIDINTKIITAYDVQDLKKLGDSKYKSLTLVVKGNDNERSGFVEQVHIPFIISS